MTLKKKPSIKTGLKWMLTSHDKRCDDNAAHTTLANLKVSEGWKLVKNGLNLIGCGLAEQYKGGKSWT